ncbi:hypothetical protein MNV49_007937 [Pseudohyphozyma bogoriensis]|nr:hypothetical protein MNV49_007937 [Pseudohyphozyma bogoriensis]
MEVDLLPAPLSPLPLEFPSLSLDSPPPPSPPTPRALAPFEALPQELIELIAFEVCEQSPYGPPATLVPLLLVSRRFHHSLGPANDGFYSDLFKQRFDWRPLERRWAQLKQIEDTREKKALLADGSVETRPDDELKLHYGSFTRPSSPSELPISTSTWRPLTSKDYAAELKRRCAILTKVRAASLSGIIPPNSSRPSSPRLQPLSAPGTHKSALAEPDDLTQNLWTCYLMLIENDGKNLEHLLHYADLKTYTRLFYKFSLLSDAMKPGWPRQSPGRGLGLWIGWLGGDDLSTETPRESDERFFVLKPYVFGAHKFDAFYTPWTIPNLPVTSDSHPLRPAPMDPFSADLRPLAHAQTITHMGRRIELAPPVLAHAAIFSFFYRIEQDPDSSDPQNAAYVVQSAPPQFGLGPSPTAGAVPPPIVKPAKTSRPELSSKIHDKDFVRMASCVDPYSSLGLPTLYCRNEIAGSWEGRFSFFDFDSYRDMLGGRMRSLYEGPFGDQPQVWRIEEKVVRIPRGRQGGSGPLLNAGFDIGQPGPRMSGSPPPVSQALPSTPSLSSGGRSRRKSIDGPGDWFGEAPRGSKRPRSLAEDVFNEEDEDEDGDYEILLTGSGHSAWGQFVLKGRIRSYDGMFTVTKDYASDVLNRESRGRWLYRGYVVGGNMVGRWRDTHTPDDLNGYEGELMHFQYDEAGT